MSKILLAGNDFRLLATRAAVLAKTPASVSVTCCNAWEAMMVLESESFDLVVLCHSLSTQQTSDITARVHQRLPKARILLVVSNIASDALHSGIKFDATSPPDPIHLIRETSELLRALPNHRIEEPAKLAFNGDGADREDAHGAIRRKRSVFLGPEPQHHTQ
jgi:CheY-like chemotaxis protein